MQRSDPIRHIESCRSKMVALGGLKQLSGRAKTARACGCRHPDTVADGDLSPDAIKNLNDTYTGELRGFVAMDKFYMCTYVCTWVCLSVCR
jgi:hypothetical protein